MKLLVLSDTQLGSGNSLAPDRLADNERALHWIADLADERDVDVVLHCGDVFEVRSPSNEQRLVFKLWADRLQEHVIPLYVISGNHDVAHVEHASALDLYTGLTYAGYEFVRRPKVIDLEDCLLACLPWAPTSGLVARQGGRADVNALAVELLLGEAQKLYEQCAALTEPEEHGRQGDPGCAEAKTLPEFGPETLPGSVSAVRKPRLLATHFLLDPTWNMEFVGKPVLPVAVLEAQGWDLIVAGDDHASGWRGERTLSLGSPWLCSWGEVGFKHGVWLVDTALSEPGQRTDGGGLRDGRASSTPGSPSVEFVPVPDRKFVSIAVDLTLTEPESGPRVLPEAASAPSGSVSASGVPERAAVSPSVVGA